MAGSPWISANSPNGLRECQKNYGLFVEFFQMADTSSFCNRDPLLKGKVPKTSRFVRIFPERNDQDTKLNELLVIKLVRYESYHMTSPFM